MAHNIKPGVATGDQVQEIFKYVILAMSEFPSGSLLSSSYDMVGNTNTLRLLK